MKALGDTLKTAREEKGVDLEQVIRDINISREYLDALENENFDIFPGETYLLGFLRNYAAYLELDSDKMVGYYKNYKINEDPIPIEKLLGPPKGALTKKILLWLISALLLAAALFVGIPPLVSGITELREKRAERMAQAALSESNVPIRPTAPRWEDEVHSGDTLVLEKNGQEILFTVSVGNNHLKLDAGGEETWTMLLGEQISIADGEGIPSWRFSLKDLGLSDAGALLAIEELEEGLDLSLTALPPPSGNAERQRELRVILQAQSPESFALDIVFQTFGLFRFKLDNQETQQKYYNSGDALRLAAEQTLSFWTSNAGAISAAMNSEDVPLGRLGEVVAGEIRWLRSNESSGYNLVMLPLY